MAKKSGFFSWFNKGGDKSQQQAENAGLSDNHAADAVTPELSPENTAPVNTDPENAPENTDTPVENDAAVQATEQQVEEQVTDNQEQKEATDAGTEATVEPSEEKIALEEQYSEDKSSSSAGDDEVVIEAEVSPATVSKDTPEATNEVKDVAVKPKIGFL